MFYFNYKNIPAIALKIVSFLMPIVGIVLYFLWNKNFPDKAKMYLKISFVSVTARFVIVCAIIFFLPLLLNAIESYLTESISSLY